MAVMPYQGIYIGFPTIFNPFGAIPPPRTNFTRINQIELSVSRDLYNWERVADRPYLLVWNRGIILITEPVSCLCQVNQ